MSTPTAGPVRSIAPRSQRGATLIELLVALLLFDLSVLSLISVSAVAARRLGEAGRRNRAAIAAAGRLESMMVLPCGAVTSGAAMLERGVAETWITTPVASGLELTDSIHIESRVSESLVLRARRLC
jgi:Tfp pilus assembly protein PilV